MAPAELEDLLLSYSKIRDAAVIGIPNEFTGELPRAFVVKADDSLTEKEVDDFVNGKSEQWAMFQHVLRHTKGCAAAFVL